MIVRKTGNKISEKIEGQVAMSENEFFKPMVDLHSRELGLLADKIRKEEPNE